MIFHGSGRVASCCGERCKWANHPIARVMLCGREITKDDQDAAKLAFLRHTERRDAAGGESK